MVPKQIHTAPRETTGLRKTTGCSEKQQGAQKNDRVFGKTRGHCTPSFMARVDTAMH